jgi:hypothetical protein
MFLDSLCPKDFTRCKTVFQNKNGIKLESNRNSVSEGDGYCKRILKNLFKQCNQKGALLLPHPPQKNHKTYAMAYPNVDLL